VVLFSDRPPDSGMFSSMRFYLHGRASSGLFLPFRIRKAPKIFSHSFSSFPRSGSPPLLLSSSSRVQRYTLTMKEVRDFLAYEFSGARKSYL